VRVVNEAVERIDLQVLLKHHFWWLSHFPKVAGRKNGIHNNWWQYIANPNYVVT